MKFFATLAAAATALGAATAASIPESPSPIPGYPAGNPHCLCDDQANFIVKNFAGMLANPDRNAANKTAQVSLANNFTESSDSINIIAGIPLGTPTFTSKQAYIAGLVNVPPFPAFTTLEVFHDCTKISWRWNITSMGRNIHPVKGIHDMEADPKTGQLKSINLEFNSIAWARDVGWTCTPPQQ